MAKKKKPESNGKPRAPRKKKDESPAVIAEQARAKLAELDRPKVRVRNKGVRTVRVADIEDAPWNWRAHPDDQKKAFDAVVDELGFYGHPDVYETEDGKLRLIDGHLRKERLLAKYGPDAEIEVNVTDFNEADAKKAMLTKDPLAAMAETKPPWYAEKLANSSGQDAATAIVRPFGVSGGSLLDPCCGKGQYATAAIAAGMRFYGNELNAKRLAHTIERLRKAARKSA